MDNIEGQDTRKSRIVLVEDTAVLREMLVEILTDENFEVQAYDSCQRFMAALYSGEIEPSMVNAWVSDFQLESGSTGTHVILEAVEQIPPDTLCQFIIISSRVGSDPVIQTGLKQLQDENIPVVFIQKKGSWTVALTQLLGEDEEEDPDQF